MNRIEFLRKSLLTIVAVAVAPSIVLSNRPTIKVPKTFGLSSQVFCFKISKEALEDEESFFEVLKEMKVYHKIQDEQLVSMETGYEQDMMEMIL